jgi:hypothetical protein
MSINKQKAADYVNFFSIIKWALFVQVKQQRRVNYRLLRFTHWI